MTFEQLRSRSIPSLRVELQEYRHLRTGARHLHLAADDAHNAFAVAFLTVPQDSTGVAHILEHTALCGSQRFPVRDPFFMMTRRSLNTFMNAFTANDWTAYPFASLNRKDFANLLDVYLDAAFFPLLDERDFAQEGHRLEFSTPDDPSTPLVYRGVVYNEMKGAMSAPTAQLGQVLQSALFPSVTYHHNSGGDPACIPSLSYQQLKAFHARHYHPSNAVFLTYGDIGAAEHQAKFEQQVLQHFEAQALDFRIPPEHRYSQPQQLQQPYALIGAEDLSQQTHIVMGWLLGDITDPLETLRARILAGVLLDNSSSPLRYALESSELGNAPSSLCGLDDNTRELTFSCGLEGSEPEHQAAVEQLILSTLEQVANQGVDPQQVAAVLHQLELSQREISGDGFPYGLKLLFDALTPMIHGGDPLNGLDLDPQLAQLQVEAQSPEFIPQLVRRLLLDNLHRVTVTLTPDAELAQRQAQALQAQLAERKAQLNAAEQQALIDQAAALQARQAQQDDPELLPRVGLSDVAAELPIAQGQRHDLPNVPAHWYAQGTNGLVYAQLVMDLPLLSAQQLDLLPLYAIFLSEVGSAGRDYLQTQALQAACTGGLSARVSLRGALEDVQQVRGVLVVAGKALTRNQAALAELLVDTLHGPRFDEHERLCELVAQIRAQREEGISDHGHMLALLAASAGLAPAAALAQRWEGLQGLQSVRALDDSLSEPAAQLALQAQLEQLHQLIVSAPRQLLIVAEAEQHTALAELFSVQTQRLPAVHAYRAFTAPSVEQAPQQAWAINAQVNFCARAYPCVPPAHPDAPVLQVLGEFLRNGWLHRAIREQGGAYGSGAGYHGDSGAFRFFSYRDPRVSATLADFDAALDWLQSAAHPARSLEEAILGVVSAIDKPGSPAGEAISSFYASLFGRTPEQRRAYRQQVLAVTLEDLQRVAATYLRPERASSAVLGAHQQLTQELPEWVCTVV